MSECRCLLPIDSPDGVKWWRPDLDLDPGPRVRAVARYGENPSYRRVVRRDDDGSGRCEHGSMINLYRDITPPMPWERVGRCWDDTPHAVVAVAEGPDRVWTAADDI